MPTQPTSCPGLDGIYWVTVRTKNNYQIDPSIPVKLYNETHDIVKVYGPKRTVKLLTMETPIYINFVDFPSRYKDYISSDWYFLGTFREGPTGLI